VQHTYMLVRADSYVYLNICIGVRRKVRVCTHVCMCAQISRYMYAASSHVSKKHMINDIMLFKKEHVITLQRV